MLTIADIKKEVATTRSKKSHKCKHITYEQKINKGLLAQLEVDKDKVMKRGWVLRDEIFGGIFPGKIYLVGAETGTGKSTFVNQVCRNVAKQGHRVVKYSLEDKMDDIAREELYYYANRYQYHKKKQPFAWSDRVCNAYFGSDREGEFLEAIEKAQQHLVKSPIIELDKEGDLTIEELVVLMEEEVKAGAKMFVIDHLHYFEFNDKERLDLQIRNIMHKINEIARKYDVAVFLIAHYKNNTGRKEGIKPDPGYFKDASAIKQVANVIIQLTREEDDDYLEGQEEDVTKFYVTKMRGPIKAPVLKTTFDIGTYQYNFTLNDTLKKKTGSTQR